jgi:urea carboxylase-associated protein 2
MGHIFCSIVADSTGWHDTVGGNLSDAAMTKRWPVSTYQQARNDWTISGEQGFLVELVKHGMDARDMAANLNFFSKVAVDESGNLNFVRDHSAAGASVELRFEMDTLVLMHTCPHPMNPASEYPKKPVHYQIFEAPPIQPDDICLNSRDENRRGFENTRIYLQEEPRQ